MSDHAEKIREVLDAWEDEYGDGTNEPGAALDELLAERRRLSELVNDAIVYLDRGEFPGDGIMARNLREALAGDT